MLAKEFISMLLSDEGRKILKKYGFRNIKSN
jgi:ABC-type molybdate transport system substrate-binding protein